MTSRPRFLERVAKLIGHSDLLGTHRIVRLLAPPPTTPRPLLTPALGLNYKADISDMIDYEIFFFGAYAPAELSFLATSSSWLQSRDLTVCFCDIGANVGQHSLFMSKKADQVHSFEPSKSAAAKLIANMKQNDIRNIRVHCVALGNEDVQGFLGSGFLGNSGSKSLQWSLGGSPEEVTVRHAGDCFRENGIAGVSLMKIDVEGYESRVLMGLQECLHRDRPIVMMELVGETVKGGFADESELRSHLYPKHVLRSLETFRGRHRLREFDWNNECAIVFPEEFGNAFEAWHKERGHLALIRRPTSIRSDID
jgi:FkbM family methyltransferase